MRTRSTYKRNIPNSPDKKELFKIRIGFVFILIGGYFLFIDTLGFSTFMDHLNFEYTTPAYGGFRFPVDHADGKMTSSVFFFLIGLFFFGWEIFDLKVRNK